jgi:hypothetical protein
MHSEALDLTSDARRVVCLGPGVGGSAVHSCARVYTLQRVHFLFTAVALSAMRLHVLEEVGVRGLVLFVCLAHNLTISE